MSHLATMLFWTGMAAWAFGIFTQLRNDDRYYVWLILTFTIWGITNLILAVVELLHADWTWGICAVAAAWDFFLVWLFWRRWKNRKKIMKLLGAKSRALRDSLVKRMREGTQPRPVKVPS